MSSLIPRKKEKGLFDYYYEDFRTDLEDFFKDRFPTMRMKDNFKLDVKENEDSYIIEAELAGVNKEDIKVVFDKGHLSITVSRDTENTEEEKNYILKERSFSSMSRSIYLEKAKKEGITANMDKGILRIVVQKQETPDESEEIKVE